MKSFERILSSAFKASSRKIPRPTDTPFVTNFCLILTLNLGFFPSVEASRTEGLAFKPSPERRIISHVILMREASDTAYGGDLTPACVARIDGEPTLVPTSARAERPSDFVPSMNVSLPACQDTDIAEMEDLASRARFEPQVAALPALLAAGVAACAFGAFVGLPIGMMDAMANQHSGNQLGPAPPPERTLEISSVSGGGFGGLFSLSAITGKLTLSKVIQFGATGGVVSFICSGVSHAGTYIGLTYLAERVKSGD